MRDELRQLQQWMEADEGEHLEFKEANPTERAEDRREGAQSRPHERWAVVLRKARPMIGENKTQFRRNPAPDRPSRQFLGVVASSFLSSAYGRSAAPPVHVAKTQFRRRVAAILYDRFRFIKVKGRAAKTVTVAKNKDLLEVLPALSREQVKTLLRELKQAGKAYVRGERRTARWFAGKHATP